MVDLPARLAALFKVSVSVASTTTDGDEASLFAEEFALIERAVTSRRREFAAGRECARAALAALGEPRRPILISPSRAPIWPHGFVGSISHCHGYCCAVVAKLATARSLGVDLEQGGALDESLAALVCSDEELAGFARLPRIHEANWPKMAFSAKEAFYKCQFQVTGTFLDFKDVSVEFRPDPSSAQGGYAVEFRPSSDRARLAQFVRCRSLLLPGLIISAAQLDVEPQ